MPYTMAPNIQMKWLVGASKADVANPKKTANATKVANDEPAASPKKKEKSAKAVNDEPAAGQEKKRKALLAIKDKCPDSGHIAWPTKTPKSVENKSSR